MLTFEYKAATADGNIVRGVHVGSSREEVVEQLHGLGHIPIRVDETPRQLKSVKRLQLFSKRITQGKIADATRELGTLLRAGLPLDRSLSILIALEEENPFGEVLGSIRARVKQGASFADAVEEFGRVYQNRISPLREVQIADQHRRAAVLVEVYDRT